MSSFPDVRINDPLNMFFSSDFIQPVIWQACYMPVSWKLSMG